MSGYDRLSWQHLAYRLELLISSALSLVALIIPRWVPVHWRRGNRVIILLRAQLARYLRHGVLCEFMKLLELLEFSVFLLFSDTLLILFNLILLASLTILLLPPCLWLILFDTATSGVLIICYNCLLRVGPAICSLREDSMRLKLSCHLKFVFLLFVAISVHSGAAIHRDFLG